MAAAKPLQPTTSRGAVIWYHGFGVDKDTHRTELARFAEAGFTAIGVDVAGHGARRAPDLDERMAGTQADALHSVIEFAAPTAAELPHLFDWIMHRGIAEGNRIAIAGISMGAFVVYRAIIEEPRVAAAVAILGSPEWPARAGGHVHVSPHLHAGQMCSARLLSITGARDENVPPGPARELHATLDALHAPHHRYIEIPGAVHLMSAAHWEVTMNATTDWLKQWLPHEQQEAAS